MELHALDRISPMADAHYHSAVGFSRHFKLVRREAFFLDSEGMIAYRFERVRKPAKHAFAAVFDLRSLPVQYFPGAGHHATECLAIQKEGFPSDELEVTAE